MKKEQELLRQIERMKEDFEQERHGYILMLRLRDEDQYDGRRCVELLGTWLKENHEL